MTRMTLTKLEQMMKIATFIMSAKTSDEIDAVITNMKVTPEDISMFMDLLVRTNPQDASFIENTVNPLYYTNQQVFAPYYKTNVDPITGATYRTIVYKPAIITAVSRDFYSNYPFYHEFLYTVRYLEDSSSRGNIFEHAILTEDPNKENK